MKRFLLLVSLVTPLVACGHTPPAKAPTTQGAAAPASAPATAAATKTKAAPLDPDAALERGRAANDAYEFETAVEELENALSIFERELEPTDPTYDEVLGELGYAYQNLQRWQDAEAVLERRLEIARASGDRLREASALEILGRTVKRSGDVHRAIPLYREALAIDAELKVAENDYGHLDRLHGLANAYDELGDHARAARMLEEVLRHEKAHDPSGARTATASHNLGLAYRDDGRYEEAREMFETALRIHIVLDGPSHPNVVSPLNGLAGTLKMMGEREDAIRTFKRVIAIAGKDTSIRAIALADLGDTEVELGQVEEGIAHLDEALAFMRKAYPSGHPETVRTLVKHAEAMLAAQRVDAAERDTVEAMRIATFLDAGEGSRAKETADWLADVWRDAGHAKRSRELRKQAQAKPVQPKPVQANAKRAKK